MTLPAINHATLLAKLINRIIEVEGGVTYLLDDWADTVPFTPAEHEELLRIAAIEHAAVRNAREREVQGS